MIEASTGSTQETDGQVDSQAPQAVQIEAIHGAGKGVRHLMTAGVLLVGSDPRCDLVIADPRVSRRHCSFDLLGQAVRVRDLRSRNGTYYQGARIEEARVPVGGTIVIGHTTLRFSPEKEQLVLSDRSELHGLVGRAPAMRRLFAILERLGPSDSTVVIRGETGSGKDGVARALHLLSRRAREPFVVFDSASVSHDLIESELFGHARGAFTSAGEARAGALECAGGGTLFLDEIGELPLDLQPKLLRAIENREFRRVGSTEVRRMNARLIAATHRDLEEEMRAGRFRADLFFRLAVTVVEVPALRHRPEDIPLLASRFARECTQGERTLDPSQLAALQCAPWPGNVRELRNSVERLFALGEAEERGAELREVTTFKAVRESMLQQFERDYLTTLLKRNGANVSAAARESGLSRSQFYRLLWHHGLAPSRVS
jgi:two-component system response regulator GlrR